MLREASVALAIVSLCAVLGVVRPEYFARENLNDLFLANLPVLIIAAGMTLVMLTGEIDISVGSAFAVCGVVSGVVAKLGVPMPLVLLAGCASGAAIGALNGSLVAYLRLPSIVVTLAMMIALRDALRWATQGAWIYDLPPGFQWMGLLQRSYSFAAGAIVAIVLADIGWGLRYTAAGRLMYATGSNPDAARLAGVNTSLVKVSAFVCLGALTGLAAILNSVRFNQIPTNAGLGLEMKVIAAVVVGGTAISGGRGTLLGTLLGVVLLGAIGPALTFLGVSAYWERAIQGGIILVAVGMEALSGGSKEQDPPYVRRPGLAL
jgi:ribose/xylose/arabinose/galactoside ABC-type transport system permease subunit